MGYDIIITIILQRSSGLPLDMLYFLVGSVLIMTARLPPGPSPFHWPCFKFLAGLQNFSWPCQWVTGNCRGRLKAGLAQWEVGRQTAHLLLLPLRAVSSAPSCFKSLFFPSLVYFPSPAHIKEAATQHIGLVRQGAAPGAAATAL